MAVVFPGEITLLLDSGQNSEKERAGGGGGGSDGYVYNTQVPLG